VTAPNIFVHLARALDPIQLALDCSLTPDEWQARLLTTTSRRVLMLCARQSGKSTITAVAALHEAIYAPSTTIILISPSQPQSTELFTKVHTFWQCLPGAPASEQETLTRMRLANGSRIISLPGSERTVRGYSGASLVIMDEAARTEDDLVSAVRPMLATTDGRFIALTTPAGKRGWFYEQWLRGARWERISVTAEQCPRISKEFLAAELEALGPMQFAQEYQCVFFDDEIAAFSTELIERAFTTDFEPFIQKAAA